jgi:hypothetical protein
MRRAKRPGLRGFLEPAPHGGLVETGRGREDRGASERGTGEGGDEAKDDVEFECGGDVVPRGRVQGGA